MRVKEWYGWHFPELFKIVPENILYARTAKTIGNYYFNVIWIENNVTYFVFLGIRKHPLPDLSEILPEELESQVKDAAKVSMGTEVCDLFILVIKKQLFN